MDEPGNHHSLQTNTRIENQTPHVLTHRWVLNNENIWTQGGEHHTLGSVVGELGEGQRRTGRLGRNNGGEMPDIGDGGWRQQTTLPCIYICNNPAFSAHVPRT